MKIYALVPGKFGLAMLILGNLSMVRPEETFLEKNGEDGWLLNKTHMLLEGKIT